MAAFSLMETRDSLRRVPQTVVNLLELINHAIHIHRESPRLSRRSVGLSQVTTAVA